MMLGDSLSEEELDEVMRDAEPWTPSRGFSVNLPADRAMGFLGPFEVGSTASG